MVLSFNRSDKKCNIFVALFPGWAQEPTRSICWTAARKRAAHDVGPVTGSCGRKSQRRIAVGKRAAGQAAAVIARDRGLGVRHIRREGVQIHHWAATEVAVETLSTAALQAKFAGTSGRRRGVRARGYATCLEENEIGVVSVAAAIRPGDDRPVASIAAADRGRWVPEVERPCPWDSLPCQESPGRY
jgi:hypothetical protein